MVTKTRQRATHYRAKMSKRQQNEKTQKTDRKITKKIIKSKVWYLNASACKLLNFDPHELTKVADETRSTYKEKKWNIKKGSYRMS